VGPGEGWNCSLLAQVPVRTETVFYSRLYVSHPLIPRPGLDLFMVRFSLDYQMYLVTRSPSTKKDAAPPTRFCSGSISLNCPFSTSPHFNHTKHSTASLYHPPIPNNVHTMVLGRLTHYAFDALAISTVLAGVKKQTGFGYVPSFSSLPLLILHF
jgi:hypothetical protein